MRRAIIIVFMFVLLGCGSDEGSTGSLPITVQNNGDSSEGHTPRGFAGSGVGLFAGDNLNPNFPNDDGVQIWLNFQLPDGTPMPNGVVLTSDALTVRGDPFDVLGALRVAPVEYETFGPQLFDLAPSGDSADCAVRGRNGLDCDVTESVSAAIAEGRSSVQFRLRFETATDGDGAQDLALFFLTDSNTNEAGIFTLVLS